MARLEDFRDQQLIGEVEYLLPDGSMGPLLFHEHAHTAFYLTVSVLDRLERNSVMGPGPYVLPACAFWFLAVESYIATLHKILSWLDQSIEQLGRRHPADRRLDRPDRVGDRTRAIHSYVADSAEPGPGLAPLQEFATFRNSIFHDLTRSAPKTEFHHTSFTPRVEKANAADAIEATRVSLRLFEYFRYLFMEADLMPSIGLGVQFGKLDELANEAMFPAYWEAVERIGLESDLGADTTIERCPTELLVPLRLVISHKGPTAPNEVEPDAETAISERLAIARNARPITDDKFRVPDYKR